MKKNFVVAVLVSCAILPVGAVTLHRSFRNGYPAEISEARSRAISSGGATTAVGVNNQPRTVATAARGSGKTQAPNRLLGTAIRTDGGEIIQVRGGEGAEARSN